MNSIHNQIGSQSIASINIFNGAMAIPILQIIVFVDAKACTEGSACTHNGHRPTVWFLPSAMIVTCPSQCRMPPNAAAPVIEFAFRMQSSRIVRVPHIVVLCHCHFDASDSSYSAAGCRAVVARLMLETDSERRRIPMLPGLRKWTHIGSQNN